MCKSSITQAAGRPGFRVHRSTMASYMLKHDGKLNRWCPVQEDVEEYFRKTLEEVCAARLASPTPTRARVVSALARETHGACSARPHPPLRTVPPSRGLGEVSPAGPPACLTGARLAPHDRLCCVRCGCLQRHVQPLLQSNLELADLRVVTVFCNFSAAHHGHRRCDGYCHPAIQAPGANALLSLLASHRSACLTRARAAGVPAGGGLPRDRDFQRRPQVDHR